MIDPVVDVEPAQPAADRALALALLALCLGVALLVAGVYVLFGLGWALVTGSLPAFVVAVVLIRGVKRAQ